MQSKVHPIRQDQLADRLIEASPVAIVITDLEAKILLLNHQAEIWFGYQEAELIGRPIELLVPDGDRGAHLSHRARFMAQPLCRLATAEPMIPGLTLRGLRKDGSEFPIRISSSLVDTMPRPLILNAMADLTPDSQSSDERIQAERLAAILQMATGLAHESHNALQRAHASLELLELDLKNQRDLLRLTERIRSALSDLLRNYEEVKNYATPIVLQYEPTHPLHLCQTAFGELVADTNAPTPRLDVVSEHLEYCIDADAARIKQALSAILDNAIFASFDDANVEVRMRPTTLQNAPAIELSVRDHGAGLDRLSAKHLFEPFFTTKQHGTGLGLALCRRVVDAHRGTVTAENHSAGGVLVKMRLPCRRPDR